MSRNVLDGGNRVSGERGDQVEGPDGRFVTVPVSSVEQRRDRSASRQHRECEAPGSMNGSQQRARIQFVSKATHGIVRVSCVPSLSFRAARDNNDKAQMQDSGVLKMEHKSIGETT